MTTALTTPDGIAYARLASLKGRIRLEKAGMTSRMGATRPKIAAELGLKPRDSHDKFIAEIERRMQILLAAKNS